MKTVILTEKPSVARDFAQTLGAANRQEYFESEDYIITWAIGHLLTPFDPDDYHKSLKSWSIATLPIIPGKFQYKPVARTKKRLSSIVKTLKRKDIDKLIVATDAGREGELIARCILTYSKVKINSFRFWTSEALTSKVINKNLENLKPLEDYDRLYAAGMARQMADWIVGMNFSRLATLKMGDLFSVGRVQTAVLALFHNRNQEIEKFIPVNYYHLKAHFLFLDVLITALWIDPTKKEYRNRVSSEEEVLKIQKRINLKSASIERCDLVAKTIKSPLLFSLTELQKEANRRHGFSAKKTLDIAQALYEKYKCLSYPRTDAAVLGSGSLELADNILRDLSKIYPVYFKNIDNKKMSLTNTRIFNDSALTDHHGLIPLKKFGGQSGSDEAKVFDLVVRRFASAFSRDYLYEDTNLYIKVGEDQFFTRGKKITDQGFKINEFLEKDILLPNVKKGDLGEVKSSEVKDLQTTPPSLYSDASILQDMANPSRLVKDKEQKKIFLSEVGLGTQATRASILETLLSRKYILRDGRHLQIMKKGSFLIENFEKMPLSSQLSKPSQTAAWELILDKMSNGDKIGRKFINDIIDFTRLSVEEWNNAKVPALPSKHRTSKQRNSGEALGVCPSCKGHIFANSKAYGCENWKTGCKFVVWKKMSGKSISKSQLVKLLKDGKTDIIKGFKSKDGSSYDSRLAIVNNIVKLDF